MEIGKYSALHPRSYCFFGGQDGTPPLEIDETQYEEWNRRSPSRQSILEEAAKAVEKMPQCPFGKGAPPNDLLPSDRCPVCGDLGTSDAETSGKCGDPATIIRLLALAAPAKEGDAG
jgi:hypothetical protein